MEMTGLLSLQSILADFFERVRTIVRRYEFVNRIGPSMRIRKGDAPCDTTVDDRQNCATIGMPPDSAVPGVVANAASRDAFLVDDQRRSVKRIDRQAVR